MKNWLTKIKNMFDINLFDINIKNDSVIITGKGNTIVYNGKNIDPKSEEGKKILKEVGVEMNNLSKDMVQMGKDLTHMFDDIFK